MRILLVSRSQEDWFSLPKFQHYRLKGLTDHDAFEHPMQQMSDVGPHLSAFALLAVAIPANIYREEWHQMICQDLNSELPGMIDEWNDAVGNRSGIENCEHEAFDMRKLDGFLSTYLLDTGWTETSEIIFADGSQERYYHVHPMLTNQLRSALLAGGYSWNWPSHLYRKHADYTAMWLRRISNIDQRMSQLYQVKAEHLSLLAACDTELAWCSKEQPQGFFKSQRQSAHFMAY